MVLVQRQLGHQCGCYCTSIVPKFYVYVIQIPESPRWHFSNGRDEEGKELSYEFARENKVDLDESVWKLAVIADVSTRT